MMQTANDAESTHLVQIPVPGAILEGSLALVDGAQGIVLFAHGSGSSRHSPRNQFVAAELRAAGLATLLIDLLTEREEALDQRTGEMRFDVSLLADRLVGVADWLAEQASTRSLHLGYFGASTGAAAALVAAARRPHRAASVVSRGGRPDLAGDALATVDAPTLLIVGGDDEPVIRLNQQALQQLHCESDIVIVPGATHLFEEPGTLEQVARLAGEWFARHLTLSQETLSQERASHEPVAHGATP
jgi:dienelactone hydrolase